MRHGFFSFSYFKTIRGCKINFTHKNIMLPWNKTMTTVYAGTQFIPVFCEDVSFKISLITKVNIQRQYTTWLLSEYSEIFFWQKEIQKLLNVIYKWEKKLLSSIIQHFLCHYKLSILHNSTQYCTSFQKKKV